MNIISMSNLLTLFVQSSEDSHGGGGGGGRGGTKKTLGGQSNKMKTEKETKLVHSHRHTQLSLFELKNMHRKTNG